MAFFTLFKVDKNENYHNFKKELSKFGEIKSFNLKPDNKDANFQFGQLDYKECKSKELKDFLAKKGIQCRESESYNKGKDDFKQKSDTPKKDYPKKQQGNDFQKPVNNSSISNPSFYFYKDEKYGKGIENFIFSDTFNKYFEIPNAQTFELSTTYPGLLVGSGYSHPKLKDDKDFQLGFFFDHTTGLPLISGSSIKGALRSVCEKKEFMQEVYGQTLDISIFEDNKTIFYDAYIVSTHTENKGKIFGSDYITSHNSNDENGIFKEPNPVKFLKVLSGVNFKFQFKATKEQVELFKQIILDFGLGAKTNVGYGKFEEIKAKN